MSREEVSVNDAIQNTIKATGDVWNLLLRAARTVPRDEIVDAAGPLATSITSIESIMLHLKHGHLESSRVRCHLDSHILFSNGTSFAESADDDQLRDAIAAFAEAVKEIVDDEDGDGNGPCAHYVKIMNTLEEISDRALDINERAVARRAKFRLVTDFGNPEAFSRWISLAKNTAQQTNSELWVDVFQSAVALMNAMIEEVEEDGKREEPAVDIGGVVDDTPEKSDILAKFANFKSGDGEVDPEVGG